MIQTVLSTVPFPKASRVSPRSSLGSKDLVRRPNAANGTPSRMTTRGEASIDGFVHTGALLKRRREVAHSRLRARYRVCSRCSFAECVSCRRRQASSSAHHWKPCASPFQRNPETCLLAGGVRRSGAPAPPHRSGGNYPLPIALDSRFNRVPPPPPHRPL